MFFYRHDGEISSERVNDLVEWRVVYVLWTGGLFIFRQFPLSPMELMVIGSWLVFEQIFLLTFLEPWIFCA